MTTRFLTRQFSEHSLIEPIKNGSAPHRFVSVIETSSIQHAFGLLAARKDCRHDVNQCSLCLRGRKEGVCFIGRCAHEQKAVLASAVCGLWLDVRGLYYPEHDGEL